MASHPNQSFLILCQLIKKILPGCLGYICSTKVGLGLFGNRSHQKGKGSILGLSNRSNEQIDSLTDIFFAFALTVLFDTVHIYAYINGHTVIIS